MIQFDIDGEKIEVSERDLFKKVLENELCNKPLLFKFFVGLIDEIPSYFWSASASSSGKFHPSHEQGDGGLVRHSLMVYRWLTMLIESDEHVDQEFIPSMIVATLFHDCCKQGFVQEISPTSGNPLTKHEHPILAAKFILDRVDKFLQDNKDFIEMTADDDESFKQDIAIVTSCIESHMGRWNKNEHSTIILPKPKSSYQLLVHLSDYIASRKCSSFDYDYFKKFVDNSK